MEHSNSPVENILGGDSVAQAGEYWHWDRIAIGLI